MNAASPLPFSSSRDLPVFILFIAAALAVYGRIIGYEFIFNWDDNVYVTGNEAVRGFTFAHLQAAFSSFYVGNYAPLHIISYMLDYTFWGMDPKGYQLTGILLHAASACLAYRLFLVLDGRRSVALAAGLIFLLHPVQVESVAWISERKTVLAMFFSLLSLHAYFYYSSAVVEGRRRWYVLSLLFLLAALLSKAVAVVIPLVMISYDWYAGGWERLKRTAAGTIPFFALAVLLSIVTIFSQRSAQTLMQYLDGKALNNALTMMPVFARYLGLLFWPTELSPIYKPPIKTAMDPEVFLASLLFAALLLTWIRLLYRRRLTGFCLTIFFVGLLPVSQLLPLPTLMQDRYLYFPLLGFSLFAVVCLADAASCLEVKGVNVAAAGVMLLTLLLGYVSFGQAAVWRNAETLWSHTVRVVPGSWQAWSLLAATRHDLRNLAGAEEAYLRLLTIAPQEKSALAGLGILYGEKGDLARSLSYLRRAVEVAPDDPDLLVNLGYAEFLKGDLDACRGRFQRAISLNPGLQAKLLPAMLETARRQNDALEVRRLEGLPVGK